MNSLVLFLLKCYQTNAHFACIWINKYLQKKTTLAFWLATIWFGFGLIHFACSASSPEMQHKCGDLIERCPALELRIKFNEFNIVLGLFSEINWRIFSRNRKLQWNTVILWEMFYSPSQDDYTLLDGCLIWFQWSVHADWMRSVWKWWPILSFIEGAVASKYWQIHAHKFPVRLAILVYWMRQKISHATEKKRNEKNNGMGCVGFFCKVNYIRLKTCIDFVRFYFDCLKNQRAYACSCSFVYRSALL